MTKTDDGLPSKIDNLGEVSSNARLIYVERADGRYDLSNAGKRLKTVRSALASGGHIPTVPIDGNPVYLAVDDWTKALAIATATERRVLLRQAAAGLIKVSTKRV